jgi:hypothetical protein
MLSASMSMMRACGSNPPFFPSAYLRLSGLTAPCRTPTAPRLPIPGGVAQEPAFDAEALLAVLVDDDTRSAVEELRVHILFPQRERC